MRRHNIAAVLALASALAAACDEENPFRSIPEQVSHGSSEVWELGLEGFPSAFDVPSGLRFFVGPSSIPTSFGTFVLTARADGTLVFRSFATLVPGFSSLRIGIQDLGAQPFAAVTEVPADGYSDPADTTGVPVLQGHTYALRISNRLPNGLVALNYAKVHALEVGQQFQDDPRSRFMRFEWAYQHRPLERDVAVVEEEP